MCGPMRESRTIVTYNPLFAVTLADGRIAKESWGFSVRALAILQTPSPRQPFPGKSKKLVENRELSLLFLSNLTPGRTLFVCSV